METTQVAPPRKGAEEKPKPLPAAQPARPAESADAPEHHEENVIPHDLPQPGWLMIGAMVVLLVALLAGLFFVGWVPHEKAREQAAGDAAEIKNEVPVVLLVSPKPASANTDLVLPCDVKANRETAIYPRTSGYLKARYVDIQDHVKEGQLLAEIDSPEVDAQLAQARVGILEAQARLGKVKSDMDLATRTVERYHSLRSTGKGTVTPQEVEEKENTQAQAASALKEAETEVLAADAMVKRLTVLQSFEKVTAPFGGTITARNFDIGALLSPGDTAPGKEMFHLAETDPMRAFVSVPQVYAGQIKINGPAHLTTNDAEFSGKVARTSESIDPNTRTMLFELDFPNKDGRLYPGMYGMARLEVQQDHPSLLIPTNALRYDASGTRVALVQDGKVHFQTVKTGRDLGTELEIVDGITPESRLVVNPGERLSEGTAVKVLEPKDELAKKETAPVGGGRAAAN